MSAKDWALMKKWHDEQIPLPLISSDRLLFRQTGRGGTAPDHLQSQLLPPRGEGSVGRTRSLSVGEGSSVPEAGAGPRLEFWPAAGCCPRRDPRAVDEEIAVLARAVRALPPSDSVPNIESSLLDLEQRFFERFLAVLGNEASSSLEREVDLMLAGSPPLDEAMLKKTRTANLRRLLRERFRLPRLSLFG